MTEGRFVTGDDPIPARGARIFFVRHGEVHNPAGIFYGRLPRFRLSETGRRQAAAAATVLAAEPLAAIYTSPLLRARQTAAVIAAHHAVPLRHSSLLLEIGTSWAGTPNKEVPKGTSFYVDRRHESDETVEDVLGRMQRLLRLLVRRHQGQIVACVSHADPIANIALWAGGHEVTAKLLQQPLAPARGAVTVFEYPDPYRATPDYLARPILHYFNPQDPEPEKPKDEQAAAEGAEPRDTPAGDAVPSPVPAERRNGADAAVAAPELSA